MIPKITTIPTKGKGAKTPTKIKITTSVVVTATSQATRKKIVGSRIPAKGPNGTTTTTTTTTVATMPLEGRNSTPFKWQQLAAKKATQKAMASFVAKAKSEAVKNDSYNVEEAAYQQATNNKRKSR